MAVVVGVVPVLVFDASPVAAAPGADLAVSLTAPATVAAGTPVTATVEVANLGTGAATPRVVALEARYGSIIMDSVTATGDGWICEWNGELTCQRTATDPVPAGATLPPIELALTAPQAPTLDLYARFNDFDVEDVDVSNDSATTSLAITGGSWSDLAVSIEPVGAPFDPGGTATYEVRVQNNGTAGSSAPVTVEVHADQVPTVAGDGWTCVESGWWVECTLATSIAAGATAPVLTATAAVPDGALEVTASASVRAAGEFQQGDDWASTSAPVRQEIDAALTLSDGDVRFQAGGPASYTATVSNEGLLDIPGPLTVDLYHDLTGASAAGTGWSCTADEWWWVSCTYDGPLAVGAALPDITLEGTAPEYTDLASLSGDLTVDGDANAANDWAWIETPVDPGVDLTVDVGTTASQAVVGDLLDLTFTVANIGPQASSGDVEVLWSASGLEGSAEATGDGWTCALATCTHPGPVAGDGSLPPIVLSDVVVPVWERQVVVSASVWNDSDQLGPNSDRLELPLVAPVDLVPSITDGDATFTADEPGTYTVSVANDGAHPSDGTLVVDLSVPETWDTQAGTAITGLTGTGWDCDVAAQRCSAADPVAAGGDTSPITVTVVAEGTSGGETWLQAALSGGGDGILGDNHVQDATPVTSATDVQVAIEQDGPFIAGRTGSATVTVSNVLPADAPGEVVLEVQVGSAFVDGVATATGVGWSCELLFARSLRCTNPGPVPGEGSLPAVAVEGLLRSGFTATTSSVTVGTLGDDLHGNNSAWLYSTVGGETDLTVRIDPADPPARFGSPVGVPVVVANVGPEPALGTVDLELAIPAGLESPVATSTDPAWSCTDVGGAVSCQHPGPVPGGGELAPVRLEGTVGRTSSGELDVWASVSGEFDATPGNDHDSARLAVELPVDLAIDLDDGALTFPITGEGTYAVALENLGTVATTGAATVTFPGLGWAVSAVETPTAGWTCELDASAVVCAAPAPSIAPGASTQLLVTVTVAPTTSTELYTTAVVSSAEDGRTDNDADTEVTPLVQLLDLAVDIDDGDRTFAAPGTGRYDVVVTNPGPSAADAEVAVELAVDGPATPAAASGEGWTCAPAGDSIVCTHPGPVAQGAQLPTIGFDVDVVVADQREVRGSARLHVPADAVATNDTDSEATPVVVPADLTVSLVPGTLVVGREGTVDVVVTNVGTGPTLAQTTVQLDRRGDAAGTGWTCADTGTQLACTHDGAVAAGDPLPTLAWTFTPGLGDWPETTLRARVGNPDDGEPSNDSTSQDVPVLVAVDLVAEATPGRSPFTVAQTESYEVVVRNQGVESAAGLVTVTLTQPRDGFPQVSGTGWECLTLFGVTTCTNPGPVPAGEALAPLTTTFEVRAVDYRTYRLDIEVDHPDDVQPANDRTTATTPVRAVDLAVTVADDGAPEPAAIGQRRSFTITATNNGGLAPTGAATITLEPSTGLLRGEVGNDHWACTPDESDFTCTSLDPVPADGPLPPLTADFYVGGGAYPSATLVARLTAPGEAAPIDNVAARTVAVTGAPDLVLAAAPGAASYDVGDVATVTHVVRNQGSVVTTGRIDVGGNLPSGLGFAGSTDPEWTCAADAESWVCAHPGPVEPDRELPALTVGFDVGVEAYPRATVWVSVDNLSDEDPANNQAMAEFGVAGIVDLEVQSSTDRALAGDEHPFEIRVRNLGTAPAGAPTVVETVEYLPGLEPVSAAGAGWTCTTAAVGFRCEHPGPVPAGGALPTLALIGAVSDTAFDVGRDCRFADVGRGLEQVCREVGIVPPYTGIRAIATNEADPRAPERDVWASAYVDQPSDLTVYAGAPTIHMGDDARFDLSVTDLGRTPSDDLVTVRARLDCGFAFTEAGTEQGTCDPGLIDLEVLGPLTVQGEGWDCAIDALDDRGVVCTRLGSPGGSLPVITVTAEMDPTFRGGFVIRPSVTNADDTNPANDRTSTAVGVDRRRLPDGVSDLTPFVGKPREREYTVGVNDLFHATIVNLGPSPTMGPITTTVELAPGFRFLRDEADDWSCAADGRTVTCTSQVSVPRHDPNLGGGFATATFVVGVDAEALPAANHVIHVSYAGDTVPTNDTRERLDAVFEGPVPTAVLGASRTVVPTPSTIDFDASLSENTGPTTVFRWDFGDGTTAFGEQVSHDYTRAGVYTATLRAYTGARYDTDTVRIIVYPDEPLVADAGDDQVVAEGEVVELDAGASRPILGIQSYRWDFGDGSTATGQSVAHEFTAPGTYDVTLTVRIGTLTATDTVRVEVVPGTAGSGGGLVIQVSDRAGAPVRLADVTVYDRNGRRFSSRADANGRASFGAMPGGAYTAYAYRTGYLPGTGKALVVGGVGTGSVVLQPGTVGDATLEHRRLTLAEITAAGIDVNDPANQHIVEFTIDLAFAVWPDDPAPVSMEGFLVNFEGEILEAPEGWWCDPDICVYEDDEVTIVLDGEEDEEAGPTIVTLVLPGKARFLKEFFEVTMVVSNLGPKGFAFTEGSATLDIPAGLALAPMAEPQSLTMPMDPIRAGSNGVARWIVRGDRAGSYDIGAAYTGVLDPVGSSILLGAESRDPLRVWGEDAVNLRVRAQREVRSGRPYRVVVGLENVSDVPVYNAGFDFGELGGTADFTYAPWTERAPTVEEIAPATTWWIELWFIPGFNGELVACEVCEDVTAAPPGTVQGLSGARAVLFGQVADPVVLDTNVFAPFADAGASGAGAGVDPAEVEIESVPDTDRAFTATALPGVDRLTWDPVDGATGYRVYRDIGAGPEPVPVAVLDGDATGVDLAPTEGTRSYLLGTVVDGDQVLAHPVAIVETAANQPPTATDQATATDPDTPVAIDVLADEVDAEDDPLTVVDVSEPANGTVSCTAEGMCTYEPDPGFEGTDSFVVTVQDADGTTTTQTITVVVAPGANRPPVAVADRGATTAGTPVDVDVLANDSDADGDPLGVVAWTQPGTGTVACTAGGSCTYENDGTAGVDTFTYDVSDGQGGTSRANVRIEVAPVPAGNASPVASFEAVVAAAEVVVDGTASDDPDGTIVVHRWDFGDGAVGTGVTASHTYGASGTYVVTLTVVDDLGAESTTTRSVEVVVPAGNVAPSAAIHASTDGLTATLDGSGSSDPDGTIVGYVWDLGDGSPAASEAVDHTYAAPGTYDVTLWVVDDQGEVGSTSTQVTVRSTEPPPGNEPPTASFEWTAAELAATFDGTGSSDVDGAVTAWWWDFGDGTSGTGSAPEHTYAAIGAYRVTLTVADDDGATASTSRTITVTEPGSPPVQNLAPSAAFTVATTELTARFDGSGSSDPDGAIALLRWHFGDGTTATGVSPTHTYAAPGTYQVTVVAIDDVGASATQTRPVQVREASTDGGNQLPVARFTVAVDGRQVTVDASTSSDPDGSVASVTWDFGEGSARALLLTARSDPMAMTHSYAGDGTYEVVLTVVDDLGGTTTAMKTVTVAGSTATSPLAPGAPTGSGGGLPDAVDPGRVGALPRTGAEEPLALLVLAAMVAVVGFVQILRQRGGRAPARSEPSEGGAA